MDFAGPADPRVKLKESEKEDEYLDLARVLNKLWDMTMTVLSIVIGTLGTVTLGLIQELDGLKIAGRAEIIKTIALLRLAIILRRVLDTCGYLLSLKFQ